MTIQQYLRPVLESNKEKVAVEEDGVKISYGDLLLHSGKVSAYLSGLGIQPQSMIGVQSGRTSQIIIAMLGIMDVRCVFVPVDGSLPEQRLKSMLEDLRLCCMLTSGLIEQILQTGEPGNFPQPVYEEGDSLYVYFTSGSTGKPKGIVGRNCSLAQFIDWEKKTFEIDDTARFSQFISPYFDAFLRDVFVPLCCGGTVCVPPREDDFFTPEKMQQWIVGQRISHIHCVPSVFRIMNTPPLPPYDLSGLRYIMLSGEKIDPHELKGWYDVFHDRIGLVNFYGPTETTMIRCFYKIKPEDVQKVRIPVGRPIEGTRIFIADKHLKPCNTLVPGELYIVSDYVSNGYLNDPVLTGQKFISIRDGQHGEVIAFKTGDLARKLVDGTIELLGREDRQIKLRGIRVELDEIEHAIMRSGAVQNVLVVQDPSAGDALVAFVIRAAGAASETSLIDSLKGHLEMLLPSYMIPSDVIEMETFPMFSNGKVNYKAMLAGITRSVQTGPDNPIEQQLLKIWKDIVGNKPISTTDKFYSAGGNSLGIMRLINKIYGEFNVRVTLADLFRNLTIKEQAVLIKKLSEDKEGIYMISPGGDADSYPLSSSQETIYFNHASNPQSTAYNMPMVWEIRRVEDIEKTGEIIGKLMERHESLRTAFVPEDGSLVQKIKEPSVFSLENIRCGASELSRVVAEFSRPFDLANAPLIRGGIIQADGRNFLVIDIHHIVCDGLSMHILYNDFMDLYYNRELKPLTRRYRDFAIWEQRFKGRPEFMRLREFWLKNFDKEPPPLNMLAPGRYDPMADNGGSNVDFSITRSTLQPLITALNNGNLSVFSGLFAVLQLLLYSLTGEEDIIIGVATSGRMQQELEDIVGDFVKILPMRFKVDREDNFLPYVTKLHKYLSDAHGCQLYDLIDLMKDLNKGRTKPFERLFDVLFNFQDATHVDDFQQESPFSFHLFDEATSNYPLELKIFEGRDAFNFRLVYATSLFGRDDADSMAARYRDLLYKVTSNVHGKISHCMEIQDQHDPVNEDITFNL